MTTRTIALCTASLACVAMSTACGSAFQATSAAAPTPAVQGERDAALEARLEQAYSALAKGQVRGASPAEIAKLQAQVRELESVRAAQGGGNLAGSTAGGITATGVAPPRGGGVVVVPGADLPYFAAGGNVIQPIVVPPPPEPPPPAVDALVVRLSKASLPAAETSALHTEVLAYLGGGDAGFLFGYSGYDDLNGIEIGGSFLRYSSAVRLFETGRTAAWLSLPTIETSVAVYFAPEGDDSARLHVLLGMEVLGFRVSTCVGDVSIIAELRGPRVGFGVFGTTDGDPYGVIELGGSASVGVAW